MLSTYPHESHLEKPNQTQRKPHQKTEILKRERKKNGKQDVKMHERRANIGEFWF